MITERAWPARAMYLLIAAALAISLILTGSVTQKVSANPGLSEWTRVDTPTTDDWLLAPQSDIIDFAVAEGGDVAYAIVDSRYGDLVGDFFLLKSEDGAATWDDITDEDWGAGATLLKVATDGVDADFLAVALWTTELHVYISEDGGTTFDEVTGVSSAFGAAADVYELEVSPEVAGERDLAIGGTAAGVGVLYRSPETGGFEDATLYGPTSDWEACAAVVDIKFAPSWDADWTVLVATATGSAVSLQFGTWGTSEGWNLDSIMGNDPVVVAGPATVPPVSSVPWSTLREFTAGITLPMDYSGRNSDGRYVWVNVNYNELTGPTGKIFRVKNRAVLEVNQQIDGTPWLAHVDYHGYIAEGKAVAGLLGDGMRGNTTCCEGVEVYRNTQITNMDICCLPWEEACKQPTGVYAMAALFVSADKTYAVALGPTMSDYDEGAWSVSFDDGDTFNQLSLIDTNIDYLSDVAVSPDCNKTMLVSVNIGANCGCDSVWLYGENLPEFGYSEYSGHWIRTWCGDLEGDEVDNGWEGGEWGFLRLNPEETTGDTVYLVDYGTSTVYWNELETLACWDRGSASVDHIVDLAVLDKETIFALDYNGNVAMSDDFAIGWHEEVASEVAPGYTIAVMGDYVLVGSEDGEVSYSDDGGETFTELDDVPNGVYVTVAFDTYFDTNMVIYAATAGGKDNGIYRWIIGESELWMDLKAEPLESQIGIYDDDDIDEYVEVDFTGIVVDRPGNPFTDPENGGVIYASYTGYWYEEYFTGAARSLERTVEICTTCLTWDFLHVGLGLEEDPEDFEATPDALKICGCLTPDSNTHLFALDDGWPDYDMEEVIEGALWTYEDCYAKKAPEITYPDEDVVVPADPCSCYSVPFTVLWDGLCDACSYDIQFALDEDFDMIVEVNGPDTEYHIVGDVPSFSVLGGPEGGLSCETTYYVRVRAADAATGEIIHSWWSEPLSFTVAPSIEAAQINLVSPEPGATMVATKDVGFSWNMLADAETFDWVLSENSDLSAPIESRMGLEDTAYTTTQTLDHGTAYFWKVTAYKDGQIIGVSPVGTFTTSPMGPFCAQDGVCFDTLQELQDYNAEHFPAQPTTPYWVWVVIGIGAALVIVVIVLIFRTRRV